MRATTKFVLSFVCASPSFLSADIPEPLGDSALEAGIEFLAADDIEIVDGVLNYHGSLSDWDYIFSVGAGQFNIDYVPSNSSPFFHFAEKLEENRVSGQIELTRELENYRELSLTVAGYDGFTNYRSIWINNWYQQNFDGFEELEEPNPYGYSATGRYQWDYAPSVGVLRAQFTLARDRIAPGYDSGAANGGIEPLRDTLNTLAWSVSSENIINARVRTLVEYQLTNQSERELRHSLIGRAHFNLTTDWYLQTSIGYTFEPGGDPVFNSVSQELINLSDFQSSWGTASLLWEFSPNLTFDLSARYYEDNGEVETATGFSSAAPDLVSQSAQIGFRYQFQAHALRLSLGWINTDYEEVDRFNADFEGLYRDRDFLNTSISYRINF